jgi:von Willebrand factor type A domain
MTQIDNIHYEVASKVSGTGLGGLRGRGNPTKYSIFWIFFRMLRASRLIYHGCGNALSSSFGRDRMKLSPIPLNTSEEESRSEPGFLAQFWAFMMSWMFSSVVHIVLLVALAVMSIPPDFQPSGVFAISASVSPVEPEFVIDMSGEAGSIGEVASPMASEATVDASELLSKEVTLTQPELGALTSMVSVASSPLNALMAAGDGSGGGGDSAGIGIGGTSFFGVKTVGKRFIYVVDNSNSMSKGRLEAAIQEVQDSIDLLKPTQYFYVIFYSDTAYPLFYPNTVKTFPNATPANKKKLREWLATVEHCLQTRGEEAMQLAFSLKPDVIYLMGDGAFTDDTVKQTLARIDPRVLIHTFGFDMNKEKDKAGFEAIAKKFRGDFHDARVSPEMLIVERTNKRPHNRFRHGVWGIKLPIDTKK